MRIGTLDAIRRYPIKSLRGETLGTVTVGDAGLPGDRSGTLFVRSGHGGAGKPYRGKDHDRLHLLDDAGAARRAAAERGVDAEILLGGSFFDAAPISLIVDRWLDGLRAHVAYAVEWERFRPNFFVRAAPEFALLENDLVDAEIEVGAATLRVREPIGRCVVTTYDLHGGESDPEILRYVAQQRNTWMGIYCDVLVPGIARVGDEVKRRR